MSRSTLYSRQGEGLRHLDDERGGGVAGGSAWAGCCFALARFCLSFSFLTSVWSCNLVFFFLPISVLVRSVPPICRRPQSRARRLTCTVGKKRGTYIGTPTLSRSQTTPANHGIGQRVLSVGKPIEDSAVTNGRGQLDFPDHASVHLEPPG